LLIQVACGSSTVNAGSADGASIGVGPEPVETARSQTVSWNSVVVEDLGHSLKVVFTGGLSGPLEENPCHHDYEVEVSETEDDVTLTVWELRPVIPVASEDTACDAVGYRWMLDVSSSAGLGDRAVIDGHDGSAREVIDETAVLNPTWLPDGYLERYRSFDGPALTIAYGPDDDSFPALMLLAAPTDNGLYNMDDVRNPDLTEAEDIGVRGNETGAVKIRSLEDGAVTIVFENGGRHYRVTAQAFVADDVLTRFVDGLA
jgi:hypothetical protein